MPFSLDTTILPKRLSLGSKIYPSQFYSLP
jgi:hypothetical protein